MAIGYFTKGELKRQQQQEQQNYVDKVVLPNAIRQQSSVVQNLSDFSSGKMQDYQTVASLPSEIQSYQQNLIALQTHGYDLGDTTELHSALSGAQKEIKNWLSKYPTESDYYNGYYYPMKYRQADRRGINDTIHGLQQQLAGTKKGSAEAKRLQSEIDWLNGNQYSYWSIDELKRHLETLENRAPGMEASKNQVDRYKADYAAAEDAYKRGKWAEAYDKMGADGRYAFSNLENWEDTIKDAEGKGRSFINNRYDKVVADNGNDVAYYYKGTKELVKDRDERKYAEAITGSEDFTHLMRMQGFSDDEIKALRRQAQEQRNAEKAIQQMQKAADYINSHGFGGGLLASALSVPQSLLSGLPAAVDQTAQTLASAFGKPNAITGLRNGVDPNRFFSRMAQQASTTRSAQAEELSEIGPEWLGDSLGFLYNTGMSIADFVVADKFGKLLAGAAKATGLASTGEATAKTISRAPMTLLGGAAATQTMQDARARGATDDQATSLGLLAGLAETIFESFSLEKLDLFRSSSKNALRYTIKEGLKDIGEQAFYEGSEELFTTLANTLSDLIVMGDKNAIQQDILRLMQEEGMSKEDATRQAWKQWAGQLGLDALAGALSGAFISGAEVGRNAVINKEVGDLIFREGQTFDLINEALALDPKSNAYQLAQDLSNRLDATTGSATKELKSGDVGRLAFMVQQARQEQQENPSIVNQMPRTHQAVQQTEGGGTEVATVLSTTAESLMSQGMTAREAASLAPTVESLLAGEHVRNSQLESIMRNAAVAVVVQERTGTEIDVKAPSSELRKVYRSVEKAQAERITDLNDESKVLQDEQAALNDEQIAVQSDANAAAERMMLDSMALEQNQSKAEPTGANAEQGTASDSDVVELISGDGTVNPMTRAEFRESARLSGSNATDEQLNAEFDMLLARYRFEGQPIQPELSRASGAAAEATPAREATGEAAAPESAQAAADGAAQETAGAGEEAQAPVDNEDAPEGITFRAKEGGVQELTREQNWAAALAYRFLRPLGVKRIIWDEAHCTESGRASINVGNGTIYLNPSLLTGRSLIFRAIGHEITHPATDDGSKVNPMAEQIINSVQEIAKRGMFRDAAKRGDAAAAAMQKLREEMLAAAEMHEVNGRADLAEEIRARAEQLVPEDILWQAENLGEVRKSITDRYKGQYLMLAAQAEAAGNTVLANEYRQNAANFDEHMANQEIAGDWIGMLMEYPELLERFAGESPKGIQRILRALNKMRYGSGIKVLSGQDRKDAEKMLDKLIDDVNAAVRKSKLRAFQPADDTKRKPRNKKTNAKVEERIKSRQDRVAEAQARVAEKAKAQRVAAGEDITKPASQERHMFVGEKSRLADLAALDVAKDMEKQGLSADQIRIVTGWFRGAENRWRYEIADDKMTLRTKGSARIYNDYPEYREFSDLELRVINGETLTEAEQARMDELGKTYIPLRSQMNKAARKRIREGTATLDDVLVHPELFEAYPELKSMKVKIADLGNPRRYGSFNPNTFELEINKNAIGQDNAEMRRTIVHEVQHAVQQLEGFARGGNSAWWARMKRDAKSEWRAFARGLTDEDKARFNTWKRAYDSNDTAGMAAVEEYVNGIANEIERDIFQSAIGAYQLANDTRSDFQLYEDTAGEREARDTEKRLERTADQRLRERPDLGENPVFSEEPYKRNPTKAPKAAADMPEIKERFQLDAPVEYTKDLVALHNASIRGLMRYLRDGGMPAPSVAIIRDNMLHNLFGDYSILLSRSSIDPEADPRNHVWAGDAYTPTGNNAQQEWGIDEDKAQEWIDKLRDALGYNSFRNVSASDEFAWREMQNLIYQIETEGPSVLAYDTAHPLRGRPDDAVLTAFRAMTVGENREAAWKASLDPDLGPYANETLNLYSPNNPVGQMLIEEAAETFDEELGTNFSEQIEDGEYDGFREFLRAVRASNADVEQWLREQFDSMLNGEHSVIVERGPYDEETLPYTAENLVKALYAGGQRRSVNTFPGDYTDDELEGWQSAAVHELHDVQQMHDYEGRLLKDRDAHEAGLNRLRDSIVYFVDDTARAARGKLSKWDMAVVLAENSELTTPDEVKDAFSDYGVKLSDEQADMALEVYKRLAELPQQYFEAKPERVVGLDEIRAVIAPAGAPKNVMDQFRDMGVPVIEYRNDAERLDALNHPVAKQERFQVNAPLNEQVLRAMYSRARPNEVVGFGRTSPVLQAVGLDDTQLLMWSTHLNQMGLPKGSGGNPHAHGITDAQAVRLPEELERPVLIFDPEVRRGANSDATNTVGVVTSMLDPDGMPIIAFVSDRGDFAQIDLNDAGLTAEQAASAGALKTAYGYGKDPSAVQQPGPTDAGFVDNHTFTKLMLDALANDDILFVNHERLRALEAAMQKAKKLSAAGEALGQTTQNFTATLPSVQRRTGTEVPGGLYTLPDGTIIHKSRNLVKPSPVTGDEVQRFAGPKSLAPDDPSARYQVDPNAYMRFATDLYGRRGLTPQAAAASAQARPQQRVSEFRANTLRHADDMFTQAELNMDGLREEDNTYDVLSNIESMRRAKERLENDYDGTIQELNSRDWRSADDLDAGMGILAAKIAEARDTGDYTDAIDWAHIVREQGTAAGQFVQAFAKYSKTPEGVLLNAVDALSQSNLSQAEQDDLLDKITEFANTLHALKRGEEGDREDLIDLILRQAAIRNTKVSKQTLKDLGMQKIDYLYDAALNQMDQIAKDYVKAGVGQQIATFQTISHLFNFKTASRNLVSNTLFSPLAAVANNVAWLPDVVASAFTGRRGVGIDKWLFSKQMWRSMSEGARTAHVELALDIDPRPNNRDKYGTARRTWKMVSNNPVARAGSTLEKAMGFELNWTDEFHKGAIRGQILNGLEPLVKSGQITQEMANEWAEQEALYRAFQDDTFANGLLGILKNGMNTIGIGRTGRYTGTLEIKQFGIGDLVQKYTQVPGALFTRAVEFSPLGYLKTIYLLTQMSTANKAVAKAEAAITSAEDRAARNPKNKALQQLVQRAQANAATKEAEATTAQRNFALAMGRATTGTGLIAAFAAAALSGILKRADDEDDPDAKALMTSMGVTGTQLNVSALSRAISGLDTKWQQGDHLVSVDFLEPMNATMTIGSLIAKEAKEDATFMEKVGNLTSGNIVGLWDALQEIPTMQTLNTIQQTRQYYDKDTAAIGIEPLDIMVEVARGSVTGFIPSPFRQVAQAMDTVQRDAYTSKNVWQQTADALKNALPGVRQQLPAKLDNFGQPRQLEGTGLNILNAAFLPGNIRTYRLSEEAEELDRVYKATGNVGIYPDRNAPYSKSVKIDGEDVKFTLSKEERTKYQETRGQETFKLYQSMMSDPFFKQATDSEKADMLAEAKAYGNYLAVKELAVGQGKSYSNAKYEKYGGALDSGFTMASWLTTTATAAAADGVDADGDGKTDDGTKKKETLQLIQQLSLSDQQKAFWYQGTSYNGEDKDKIQNAMSQGINPSTYIDAQIKLADAHGVDENGDGKTDSGSLSDAQILIIRSLPMSPEQRKWLYLQIQPNSTKKADRTDWSDLN